MLIRQHLSLDSCNSGHDFLLPFSDATEFARAPTCQSLGESFHILGQTFILLLVVGHNKIQVLFINKQFWNLKVRSLLLVCSPLVLIRKGSDHIESSEGGEL